MRKMRYSSPSFDINTSNTPNQFIIRQRTSAKLAVEKCYNQGGK